MNWDDYDHTEDDVYVYDQCCGNCGLEHTGACPMREDPEKDGNDRKEIQKKQKEDAVLRNGKPDWCIYWRKNAGV